MLLNFIYFIFDEQNTLSQKTVKLTEVECLKSLALPEKSLEKQKNCW